MWNNTGPIVLKSLQSNIVVRQQIKIRTVYRNLIAIDNLWSYRKKVRVGQPSYVDTSRTCPLMFRRILTLSNGGRYFILYLTMLKQRLIVLNQEQLQSIPDTRTYRHGCSCFASIFSTLRAPIFRKQAGSYRSPCQSQQRSV